MFVALVFLAENERDDDFEERGVRNRRETLRFRRAEVARKSLGHFLHHQRHRPSVLERVVRSG